MGAVSGGRRRRIINASSRALALIIHPRERSGGHADRRRRWCPSAVNRQRGHGSKVDDSFGAAKASSSAASQTAASCRTKTPSATGAGIAESRDTLQFPLRVDRGKPDARGADFDTEEDGATLSLSCTSRTTASILATFGANGPPWKSAARKISVSILAVAGPVVSWPKVMICALLEAAARSAM